MAPPSDREKRIIRDLPDVKTARTTETKRSFRDLVSFYNKSIFKLGLCDGHKCIHHKEKVGTHQTTCYCRRSLNSDDPKTKKFWDKMHWENCSHGRSMEKNLGCKGFEPADKYTGAKGMPLYQQKVLGRKIA